MADPMVGSPDPPHLRPRAPFPLREASRAALVTALGLALPVAFHAVHLGSMFLPMFHPILAGAFFLAPAWAACTGVATPLLSALATGMPPLFPPVAVWMAVELGTMAGITSVLSRRTRLPVVAILAASLAVGRLLYLTEVYLTARWLNLPADLLAGLSFFAGWPGLVLCLAIVPPAVAALRSVRSRG